MERARGWGGMTPYALLLPHPPRSSAGWPPTCVFVTVNEVRRYLATSKFSQFKPTVLVCVIMIPTPTGLNWHLNTGSGNVEKQLTSHN
jgi:hypothetical protein